MAAGANESLGIPYQGNKRRIATRVVDLFPAAPVLVDVFSGGCAITHAALLSGKFDKVIVNDLSDAPTLFYIALKYGVPEKPRWVSREEFFALKDRDPLIRYCYSFKNDGRSYCYGRDIEPLKRAAHRAVVDGDLSELPDSLRRAAEFSLRGVSGVAQRYAAFIRTVHASAVTSVRRADIERFNQIRCLEHITRFARIARIAECRCNSLSSAVLLAYRRDYRDLYLPDEAVVYCDPPYANTTGYGSGFDHQAFYAYCRAVGKHHPLFVSEYWMPSDFRCVAEFTVRALAGSKTNAQTRVEKIFTL